MRPPVVGFRHPSFRRCKYFAPYRGDIKPPLELVVMTLKDGTLKYADDGNGLAEVLNECSSSGFDYQTIQNRK